MNNYCLDKWIPVEETHLRRYAKHNVSEVMFKVFDEYCEEGIATASVCLKFDNGDVTGFYHPPENCPTNTDERFLFDIGGSHEA
jgi:hypothetical protein